MSETEHGYSPDVGGGGEEAEQAGDLAFQPEAAGEPGPGREPSAEEEAGVPATDTGARTPLGVGASLGRSGERTAKKEREPGRERGGVKGGTDRPHGESTLERSTGIQPEEPISEESPPLPPGDQGG